MNKKIRIRIFSSVLVAILLISVAGLVFGRSLVEYYVTEKCLKELAYLVVKRSIPHEDSEDSREGSPKVLGFDNLNYSAREIVYLQYGREHKLNVWAAGINESIKETILEEISSPAKLRAVYDNNIEMFLEEMLRCAAEKKMDHPKPDQKKEQIREMFLLYAQEALKFFHYLNFALGPNQEELIKLNKALTEANQREETTLTEYRELFNRFYQKWDKVFAEKGVSDSEIGQKYWQDDRALTELRLKHDEAKDVKQAIVKELLDFVAAEVTDFPVSHPKEYYIQWIERLRARPERNDSLEEAKNIAYNLHQRLKKCAETF